jgi:hypothetical protein
MSVTIYSSVFNPAYLMFPKGANMTQANATGIFEMIAVPECILRGSRGEAC